MAVTHSRSVLRQLNVTQADARLYDRLADSIFYANASLRADHGKVNDVLPLDGGDAEEILAGFARVGVDNAALDAQLQRGGAQSFDKSWNELMDTVASKRHVFGKTTQTGGKP